ncbi:MAG: PAS domain S-box protein, partial [Deltaproteobacteria bacterium]|nr:PAS domain S-box protein [Deltaproteobacteria bacterium]
MNLKKHINIKSLYILNITILVLVVVLGSSQYFLSNELVRSGYGDAKMINIAGRQRMLSQRLTREALLLAHSKNTKEWEQYQRSIGIMMAEWSHTHEVLRKGDPASGIVLLGTPDSRAIFQKLDEHFLGLKSVLHQIITPGEGPGVNPAFTPELLHSLITHSDGFLVLMDNTVGWMEKTMVEKQIAELKHNMSLTWASVVLLLILEGFFLSLSVVLRARKTQFELKTTVDLLQNDLALGKEALWRSEQFKSAVLANSSEGIVTMDESGLVVEINQAIEGIFGFTKEEAVGKSVAELFIPPHLKERHILGLEHFRKTGHGPYLGKRFEVPAIRKDGSTIHVEMVININEIDGHQFFTSFIRDITQRKQDEVERMRLSMALEQVVESVIITDTQGEIQFVNSAFEKNTGYTRAEVVRQNPRFLKSGKQNAEFYGDMWRTIKSGSTWFGNLVNVKKDGTHFEEEASISPVFNDTGEIINYIAVKRDVTEERQREMRLRQSEKMEAIGVLSGGIAHDFNNILTPILGYTELAKRDLPSESKVREYLDVIERGALRAKDLVAHILLFSRKGISERRFMDLPTLVREVFKLLHTAIPKNITVQEQFDSDLPMVKVDATQIHQILVNLCTNAAHAMPKGGLLTVGVHCASLSEFTVFGDKKISGNFVRLSVSDNGTGMDQTTMQHIFEPFFTTKENGKGTGLGLSTVYGAVKNNRGYIAVNSTPGMGTAFEIYFPAASTLSEGKSDFPLVPIPKGWESVLFIDDEIDIVASMKFRLGQFGYRITGYTDPGEA